MSILQTPTAPSTLHLDDLADGTPVDATAVSLARVRETLARGDWSPVRAAAMWQLARSDFPNTHRDLERVLANADEPPVARQLAALALVRLGTRGAAAVLLTHIDIDLPAIRGVIVNGLARIGGAIALPALGRLAHASDTDLAHQARFAATLITHRLRLVTVEAKDLPSEEGVDAPAADTGEECGRTLALTRPDPAEVELCLRSISRALRHVEWLETHALRWQCGQARWILLLNREVMEEDAAEALTRRPLVLGVAARRDHRTGRYGAALAVLATPSAAATVALRVYGLDGTRVARGSAHVADGSVGFSIRPVSAPRPYTISMDGRLAGGELSITRAVAVAAAKRTVVRLHREPVWAMR